MSTIKESLQSVYLQLEKRFIENLKSPLNILVMLLAECGAILAIIFMSYLAYREQAGFFGWSTVIIISLILHIGIIMLATAEE